MYHMVLFFYNTVSLDLSVHTKFRGIRRSKIPSFNLLDILYIVHIYSLQFSQIKWYSLFSTLLQPLGKSARPRKVYVNYSRLGVLQKEVPSIFMDVHCTDSCGVELTVDVLETELNKRCAFHSPYQKS